VVLHAPRRRSHRAPLRRHPDRRDDYDDEDNDDDLSHREMGIRYVTPLLGWADVLPFAASYPEWPTRWLAARAALFKGYAYRADLQDFLAHHRSRMEKIAVMRREDGPRRYNEIWGSYDVTGLSVDWKTGTIHFPEGSTESQKGILTEVLLRGTAEQTGARGKYLRQWYGRIEERYRGSRTKIVFLRLPRSGGAADSGGAQGRGGAGVGGIERPGAAHWGARIRLPGATPILRRSHAPESRGFAGVFAHGGAGNREPARPLSHAVLPHGRGSVWQYGVTPGFLRLAGIWANHLTFMSRTQFRISPSRIIVCGNGILATPRSVSGVCREAKIGSAFGWEIHYRALGKQAGEKMIWVWIGTHSEYDRLVGS
jgi:hypothetical protein